MRFNVDLKPNAPAHTQAGYIEQSSIVVPVSQLTFRFVESSSYMTSPTRAVDMAGRIHLSLFIAVTYDC